VSYKDRALDLSWVQRDKVPLLAFPYRYNVEARRRDWFDRPRGAYPRLERPAVPVNFRFESGWISASQLDYVRGKGLLLATYARDGSTIYLDVIARVVVPSDELGVYRERLRALATGDEVADA
jgi:hypothetical protein